PAGRPIVESRRRARPAGRGMSAPDTRALVPRAWNSDSRSARAHRQQANRLLRQGTSRRGYGPVMSIVPNVLRHRQSGEIGLGEGLIGGYPEVFQDRHELTRMLAGVPGGAL